MFHPEHKGPHDENSYRSKTGYDTTLPPTVEPLRTVEPKGESEEVLLNELIKNILGPIHR